MKTYLSNLYKLLVIHYTIPEKIAARREGGEKGVSSGWGYTFLKKIPGIFRFVILALKISEETSFYLWKFCKIAWHP